MVAVSLMRGQSLYGNIQPEKLAELIGDEGRHRANSLAV